MPDEDRLADDTQQNRTITSADSSAMGVSVAKSCCMCGVDLQGHTRYKDSTGRYWCPPCNEKDQLAKEPASCPDCNENLTKADLVDFKGASVCQPCWEKRRGSARREEARLRAVEEEIRDEEDRKKRWKLIISAVLAVFVLAAIIWGVEALVVGK